MSISPANLPPVMPKVVQMGKETFRKVSGALKQSPTGTVRGILLAMAVVGISKEILGVPVSDAFAVLFICTLVAHCFFHWDRNKEVTIKTNETPRS